MVGTTPPLMAVFGSTDSWLRLLVLDDFEGTKWGWLLLGGVVLLSGGARLGSIMWSYLAGLRRDLQEIKAVCESLSASLDKWSTIHSENFGRLERSIILLLQDHRRAVVCEPQSFMQPLLLENWNQTRLDILQQIRLLGLELQDMRHTMDDLIKVQALIRKSLVPVTTDTPADIKEINGHLSMIREGIELDTQGLIGAVHGMEERLQRVRQEQRAQPALHPHFQSEVLVQLSVIRSHLSSGGHLEDATRPDPPPWT
ncbi:TTN [Symbiodinium sp. CCMP2592]|nr:TTN [Symbiodinium sp. CCMP2592]